MAEYIEREKVLSKAAPVEGCFSDMISAYDVAMLPAADVAPVRHGRWIDGDPYCPICRKDKFRGLDADVWADWQPDYCPNCGAKMDGGAGNGC